MACSETFVESETVNGVPELCVAIALICQSSSRTRSAAGSPPETGGSQLALATKRWRASNSDGPYSASRSNGFCARSFSPASGLAAAPDRFIAERWSSAFDSQYDTLKPKPSENRRETLNWPELKFDEVMFRSIAIVEKSQVPPSAGQFA